MSTMEGELVAALDPLARAVLHAWDGEPLALRFVKPGPALHRDGGRLGRANRHSSVARSGCCRPLDLGQSPDLPPLAYLEREADRRAKGVHRGMMRLQGGKLAAFLNLLRCEVGTVETVGVAG